MSLEDTIRDLKVQLEAADKEEEEKVEDVVEPEEPVKEEAKVEQPEEKPAEPVKEEPLDDAGYARLRREAKAAKRLAEEEARKREELEDKLRRLETPQEEQEPRLEIPDEFREIIESHKLSKAESEFLELENQFKRSNPNAAYDDVANQYASMVAASVKALNPRMSNDQVARQTKQAILEKAASYLRSGFDPIEEMYHDALELGLKPRAKEEPKSEPVKEVRPDMAQLAKNRARSAGMVDASGKEEGVMTQAHAVTLSAAEWAKLPAGEKRRLMYGA